jgi:hypothetical protein
MIMPVPQVLTLVRRKDLIWSRPGNDKIVAIDVLADPQRLSRIRNKIRPGSGT